MHFKVWPSHSLSNVKVSKTHSQVVRGGGGSGCGGSGGGGGGVDSGACAPGLPGSRNGGGGGVGRTALGDNFGK